MTIIFVVVVLLLSDSETFKYVGTVQTIALFFGSVIYAFEGIGMVRTAIACRSMWGAF